MKKPSIIVSNWNGRELLKEFLPSVIEAIKYSGLDYELTVVDDASSDGSQEFIKESYPQIKLMELKRHKGFGEANNIAVEGSKNGIVVLLNNDMRPEKDFFVHLLNHFTDLNVFAVASKMFFSYRIRPVTYRLGYFKYGFIDDKSDNLPLEKNPSKVQGQYITFSASGGGVAIDRKKFLALGGFDKLYYPFYYEDVDLSYRAWKRGWKILYEPKSIIYHECGATTKTYFDKKYISLITKRNYYLFLWKNITDNRLFLEHLFFLPIYLLQKLLGGRTTFIKAFFLALKQLPDIRSRRQKERREQVLTDREVSNLFK